MELAPDAMAGAGNNSTLQSEISKDELKKGSYLASLDSSTNIEALGVIAQNTALTNQISTEIRDTLVSMLGELRLQNDDGASSDTEFMGASGKSKNVKSPFGNVNSSSIRNIDKM